jgi:hypothetical protein
MDLETFAFPERDLMTRSFEQRITALEQQVAQLRAQRSNGRRKKDWRRTVGIFTDNPAMQELFAEAMKLREADRKKARRKRQKPQRAQV